MNNLLKQIAPFDTSFLNRTNDLARPTLRPPSALREIGDVAKAVSMINVQGDIVTAWLNTRDDQTEITVQQEVSTGGLVFARTTIGRITVHTK